MSRAPGLEERVFARLETLADLCGPVFLVGLSGGGDSTALMEIATAWAARKGAGSGVRVSACIVDHGLRAGSAGTAQAVARYWLARGAVVQVRRWEQGAASGAPTSQAAARAARHALLADAARTSGAGAILLAHTADDQAETLAMRLVRTTGPDGLAGMAQLSQSPADPLPGAALVARPLLDVRRLALRDWLVAKGLDWIEDPANREHRFTRVAVRSRLAALAQAEPDPAPRLLGIGALATQLRQLVDADALILAAAAEVSASQLVFPDAGRFPVGPALVRAIGWAVAAAGSAGTQPAARPVDPRRIAQALDRTDSGRATNLGGALIRHQHGCVLVRPEPKRRGSPRASEDECGRLVGDRWRARLAAVRSALAMDAAHPPGPSTGRHARPT